MKEYITVYLSGEGLFGPNDSWRKEAMRKFYKIAKYDEVKICVVNPTDFVATDASVADRQTKSFLFSKIRQSDIVLCNLSNTSTDPYVAAEVQYAVDNHINVIGIDGVNVCGWVKHVDCDAVFSTLEEAVMYIKEYYAEAMRPINIGA